ncbi:hypothetical protein [Actinoplanes sp. NPDC051851]|uniref:hypothetical protein n=1 Tax=Actinoplanes sp. NPDC051851 TaxID=3154753 RepID=UPI00342B7F1E
MPDDAAAWIVAWWSSRTADDWRRYAWFATVLVVLYYTLRWAVRRFAPWLIGRVLTPIAGGLVLAVCGSLILAAAVVALPFRPVRVRPPGLLFWVGDTSAAAGSATRRAVRRRVGGPTALRRTPRLVIWALFAGIAWAGHEVACDQDPASLWCTRPLSAVTVIRADLWESGTDLILGRSS